jgi:hypothetical protein
MKSMMFRNLPDQKREALVDVARKAFAKTKCHDATSLAWVLKDLTKSGALVWLFVRRGAMMPQPTTRSNR